MNIRTGNLAFKCQRSSSCPPRPTLVQTAAPCPFIELKNTRKYYAHTVNLVFCALLYRGPAIILKVRAFFRQRRTLSSSRSQIAIYPVYILRGVYIYIYIQFTWRRYMYFLGIAHCSTCMTRESCGYGTVSGYTFLFLSIYFLVKLNVLVRHMYCTHLHENHAQTVWSSFCICPCRHCYFF